MEIDVMKVQILMAECGISQIELSRKCSVTRQNISRILSKGRCNPVTAGKIAYGLGVRVSEIVKGAQ